MHRRSWLPFGILAFLIPAIAHAQFGTQATAPAATSGAKLGPSETHKWEFGIIVRANRGACGGLYGTIPVPQDWPEQQVKIVNEEISPHVRGTKYRTIDGLKQLLFEVPTLAGGETATCLVTFEITTHAQAAPADTAGLVVPKDPPRDVRKYLGPSPQIESTNAKIRSLAKELVEGKEGGWSQVEAILAGVREKVRFEPENKDKMVGAIGALRNGKADREDLTALFIAACRAAKIPARFVWVFDGCHAEFYLEDAEGKGAWHPCIVHENAPPGVIKTPRPIIEKGDNFKTPETKEPQRFVAELLAGRGKTGERPEVEFRRRMAD